MLKNKILLVMFLYISINKTMEYKEQKSRFTIF
jgi:hypothetical protein